MNLIIEISFVFFVGAVGGWFIELIYRRIFSAKKWINPGFLNGPWLPLYGFGLGLLYLISSIKVVDNVVLNNVIIIVIMFVAMTLIEFVAGYIFILTLHIKLWDYSKRWGNYKGIVCPLFSLFWGLAGTAYFFLLHPLISKGVHALYGNTIYLFLIGIVIGIFIIDNAISFNVAAKIRKFAKESKIVVHYEELKESISNSLKEIKKRSNFLLPFKSTFSPREIIEKYKETHSNK